MARKCHITIPPQLFLISLQSSFGFFILLIAKEYTVSYEGRTETTTVTYEQPYELETPRQGYTWYYGEENVPTTGDSWKIADDVTLVEGSIFKNKLLFSVFVNR